MIQTKSFYQNESVLYSRSEEPMFDLGYSLDIPANDIYTAGWIGVKPETWGKENLLITRPDPEYFAPGNIIRSNVIPHINPHDPIFQFDRRNYTFFAY